jgi:chlorite dismutase
VSEDRANGQPAPSRQYVQFIFYKVDPAWRRLSTDARAAAGQDVITAVEASAAQMQVRAYSLVGVRGDADFMFWHISDDLPPLQDAATRLLGSRLGPYLSTPYAYLAMTRKSVYLDKSEPGAAARRLRVTPGTAKYLFVYPFVKTRAWYGLSLEERQKMMDAHIRIGRKYPTVKLNTTYSFGLDDQEFVVAFETDEPGDFLDLVMELRETESSLYTLRDTPAFTCVAATVAEMLERLGAPGDAAATPAPVPNDEWMRVCAATELTAGSSRAVYVRGEQLALFHAGGGVYAVEARCPHASAPLAEGTLDGTLLTCERHGSRFDLARCEVVRGPAARPPRCYAVKVEDGSVYVGAESAVARSR